MRICPVQNYRISKSGVQKQVNTTNKSYLNAQTNFKGWKGLGTGAGLGAIWAGVAVAMTAVGAPYLLPIMGTKMVIGAIGTGAFAGHCIENEMKDHDKE